MNAPRVTAIALTALILISPLIHAAPDTQPATNEQRTTAASAAASNAITGVTFDFSSWRTLAPGSDNWPATWSSDGNQYAMWGDGGGFGGTDTDARVSLGVGRIVGDYNNYQGFNRYGGKNGQCASKIDGKVHGAPLSLGANLYAWITPGSGTSGYESFTLYKSTDNACTWTPTGVSFYRTKQGIGFGSFVQFGQNNSSAIDGYVYTVAVAISDNSSLGIVQRPGRVMLLRVLAGSIEAQAAYQFFAGLDANGQPTWSSDVSKSIPVYTDPAGVGPFAEVSYDPGLGRFVYTNQHGNGSDASGIHSLLTMADAPRPWGPWTDFYRNVFFPQIEQSLFQWNFGPKWFRNGGRSFTLIFSGTGTNDSWNTVNGTFSTSVGFVQMKQTSVGASGSNSLQLAMTVQAGNTLAFFVNGSGAPSTMTVSDGANTYNLVRRVNGVGYFMQSGWAHVTTGGSVTLKVTLGGGLVSKWFGLVVEEWQGLQTLQPNIAAESAAAFQSAPGQGINAISSGLTAQLSSASGVVIGGSVNLRDDAPSAGSRFTSRGIIWNYGATGWPGDGIVEDAPLASNAPVAATFSAQASQGNDPYLTACLVFH